MIVAKPVVEDSVTSPEPVFEIDGQRVEPFLFEPSDGPVFADGSCTHGRWWDLARAGWGLAQKVGNNKSCTRVDRKSGAFNS